MTTFAQHPDESTERTEEWVAALEVERQGHIQAGRADRVAEVEAELARLAGGTTKKATRLRGETARRA